MTDLMNYYNEIWAGGSYAYDANHSSSTDDRRFGWGQTTATLIPTPITGELITADVFNQAIAQVNAGQYHISDLPGNLLIKLGVGDKILNTRGASPANAPAHYNNIISKIENLQNNKYVVDWSDWDKDRLISLNTQPWDEDLSVVHKFSFTDYNEARHFFNSGGELTLELEMDPGGPPGNDVWRQVFDQFDSIRIGAETCRVVADNVYDILSTSTVNPKGFYNGIVYSANPQWSTILDAGVFKFAGGQGEYAYAYVYVYSEYNSRRIQLQIKADEVGGTFNVYVRVNLIEDEDDVFSISQPIKLYSGWVNPTQAPAAGDGNEHLMTANSGTIYRFAERTVPIITEESPWTKVNLHSGMQLDAGLNDDWTGTTLVNVPSGHFDIGKEYKIVSLNHEIPATRIETGETYRIKTVGTTDFTKLGAANNNIGTVFTATLTDDTTGTVTLSTATDTDFTIIGAADNNIGTTFTALGVGTGDGRADEVSLNNTDPGVEWTKWSARYYKNVRAPQPSTAITYSLATNATDVNEGGTFTITLATQNVAAGTPLLYTITGVESADINGASLTGQFVVGTTNAITFTVSSDGLSEGQETFAIALDNGQASTTVTINDTSQSVVTPSYVLAVDNVNVNEGGTFTVSLTPYNALPGDPVPYTITGVESADIDGESLSGSFTVGTSVVKTFTVTEDTTVLEGDQTFTLTLDGYPVSVNVLITDSSIKMYELRDIYANGYKNIIVTTAQIDTKINAIEAIRQASVAQSVTPQQYNTLITLYMNDNINQFNYNISALSTAQQDAFKGLYMAIINVEHDILNTTGYNTNYGSAYKTDYTLDTTGYSDFIAFSINNESAYTSDKAAFNAVIHNEATGEQAILSFIDDRDIAISPTTPVSSNFWQAT
jgi:hypothetical protein